jgi:hypothetical protein
MKQQQRIEFPDLGGTGTQRIEFLHRGGTGTNLWYAIEG